MKNCYLEKQSFYFCITLLIIFLLTVAVNAQWLNNSGIQTNILSVTQQSTKIEYILTNYDETTIDVNGTECVYYQIPGSIFLMEKGLPQLPTDRKSIIIPDLAATSYRILDVEYVCCLLSF